MRLTPRLRLKYDTSNLFPELSDRGERGGQTRG